MHAFVGGILRDLRCTPLAIKGMVDHIHILAGYPSDLSHSDMVRHVKSRSSKWVNEEITSRTFGWQNGYGGFTVSKSMVDTVTLYIAEQKKHHESLDFKSELLGLLRRHDIRFDEAEVFD